MAAMRIYFSGSISGGRDHAHIYPHIIACLKKYGEVLTEFVADPQHTQLGEQRLAPEAIYRRDMGLIDRCDVLVAEVTVPSFGVGVEVALAGAQGKPVLALYHPAKDRRLSAMIAGDPNVTVVEYVSTEDAMSKITNYFEERST